MDNLEILAFFNQQLEFFYSSMELNLTSAGGVPFLDLSICYPFPIKLAINEEIRGIGISNEANNPLFYRYVLVN